MHLSGNWNLLHPAFPLPPVWLFKKSDFDSQNSSDHLQFSHLYFFTNDIHCVQKKTSPCVFFYNF